MLSYHIVVCHLTNHLDVVLLLPLRKLRLQNHKKVSTILILVHCSLSKGRHLAGCEVYPTLDIASSVIKEEHVSVVLSSEVFESSNDGDGIEALSFEGGIVSNLLVELMEGEWDDGSVVDGFVLFFS